MRYFGFRDLRCRIRPISNSVLTLAKGIANTGSRGLPSTSRYSEAINKPAFLLVEEGRKRQSQQPSTGRSKFEGQPKLPLERTLRVVCHLVCRDAPEVLALDVEVGLSGIRVIQDVVRIEPNLDGLRFGNLERLRNVRIEEPSSRQPQHAGALSALSPGQ